MTAEAPGKFAIDHLVPGKSYTLYLYAQAAGWADYGAAFTVTNTSASVNPQESTGADPDRFAGGLDVAIFRDVVADASGHIGGSWQTSSLTADPSEGDFNGLSIVSTSPQGTEVINVDFDLRSIPQGTTQASPVYVGPGAVQDPGRTYWNDVAQATTNATRAISSGPLKLSDGVTPSAVTVTVTNFQVYYVADPDPSAVVAPALFNDYFYVPDPEGLGLRGEFAIEHLTAGQSYALYLYGSAAGYDPTTEASFNLANPSSTSNPQETTGGGTSVADLQLGIYYVAYANVIADAQGRITGTWGPSSMAGDNTEGDFNGFQLVSQVDFPSGTIRLANPRFTSGKFSFDLPTQSGSQYTVEYKESVAAATWIELQKVTGNGGLLTVTDPAPNLNPRFYRVRLP